MLTDADFAALLESPGFKDLPRAHADRVRASAQRLTVPADTRVFDEGDACETFLVILSGTLRVSKVSDDGRELLLYHVRPGEYCVQAISCLLGHSPYTARGVTVDEVAAVAVPEQLFGELIAEVAPFREMIFEMMGTRMSVLMRLVEEVAFHRLDRRLASLLSERTSPRRALLETTHQRLAEDLGTSREIVSRILESFESQGLVRLGRGRIEILEHERVTAYPDGP